MWSGVEKEDDAKKSGKPYKRTADRGKRAVLVKPKDNEESKTVDGNMANAAKMEVDIANERTKADKRGLTDLDVIKAVQCLERKELIGAATRQKCEKDDYGLYGIKIGTRVTSQTQVKTGAIIAVRMDEKDGYYSFTIKWDESGGPCTYGEYSTDDVLGDADPGQGVVTLAEDVAALDQWMKRLMVLMYTHMHYFITHNQKIKRKYDCVDLGTDEEEEVMALRKYAWDETKDTKAAATLNEIEIGLLAADAELVADLKKDKSCLEMMELASSDVTAGSLLFSNQKFHSTHQPWVKHFVRGAQASWRLGRLINMDSCMALICANELDSIPRPLGRTDLENDRAISVWKTGDVEEYGMAVRALRARAKVENGNCHWLPHYPLYRLPLLSRPTHLGDRSPRTENTQDVSSTRRHLDVHERVARLSETREEDAKFFGFLDKAYHPVGVAKKVLADIREGELARLGCSGAKVVNGRMPAPDDEEGDAGFKRIEDMAMRNSIEPFLTKVPNRVKTIEMCYEVLKRGASYNKRRKNADHLYPKDKRADIDAVVEKMDKVTRSVVSTFSEALQLADSVTSACLRPEDYVGVNVGDTHVISKKDRDGNEVTKVRVVLPAECKNREHLHASNSGVAVNHTKDDAVADGFVVMVIIARPLMKKLLAEKVEEEQRKLKEEGGSNLSKRMNDIGRKYRLTEKLCPFTENGEAYNNSKMYDLYQYVGRRALGIPFFGLNVLRSVHVTKVVRHCLLNGIDPNHPDVVRLFALARHGEDERIKTYDLMKADMVELGGNSFGYVNRGINSTGSGVSSEFDEVSVNIAGLPGMADFGFMNTPEYQSATQVVPAVSAASSSANDRLVRMVEESHQRELARELAFKQRELALKDQEIAELRGKRKISQCKPEVVPGMGTGRKHKTPKKGLTEMVRKRIAMLQEMHPIFVKVAREVWSGEPKNATRLVMVDGKQKNRVGYMLSKARGTPTSLLEDCVKEKMMLADPIFCQKFYDMFPVGDKGKRRMKYPLELDPSCWPVWIEDN